MRSIRLFTGAAAALILGSACGGDGGGDPNTNAPPAANFVAPTCTVGVACAFTADPSTDDVAITAFSWEFTGSTPAEATTKDASYIFTAAGTPNVTLTVTDAEGLSNSKTLPVTVNPGTPGNTAPVSSFVLPTGCVADTPCGFASTSTDAEDPNGVPTSSSWDFGDGTPFGSGQNVTHTYEEAGLYTVVLTVTDAGGLTGTSTQQLTVSAPAATDCTTTGTLVTCSFTMTQRVTVKLTVIGENCELSGNRIEVTAPRQQTAFFNLCNQPAGAEYTVHNGDGPPATPTVFEAGTAITLRFTQGPQGTNPPVSDPGIQVDGSYPNWTLNVDDGGAAGTPGEPDFNDVVISVQATVAP